MSYQEGRTGDGTGIQDRYPPPPGAPRTGARIFSVAAIIFGVLSLVLFPILFGPLGIVFGIVGWRMGDRLGVWGAVIAGVGMIVGMILGAIVFSHVVHTQTGH